MWFDLPVWTTSGRRSRHLTPCCALSASGSALIGSTRLFGSVSLAAVSSLRHREMSLGLKMRAAEVGMVFWKKLRSSTFIARFTGGANISSVASARDIEAWDGGVVAVAGGGVVVVRVKVNVVVGLFCGMTQRQGPPSGPGTEHGPSNAPRPVDASQMMYLQQSSAASSQHSTWPALLRLTLYTCQLLQKGAGAC